MASLEQVFGVPDPDHRAGWEPCRLTCKNLQDVPEHASTIGIDRRSGRKADPDFPGSAAMCCHCLLPVTPEAAGSSPVDPANSFAHAHSSAARRPQASRRSRGAWHESRRPRQLIRSRSFVSGATSSGIAPLSRRLARVPSTPPTKSAQRLEIADHASAVSNISPRPNADRPLSDRT